MVLASVGTEHATVLAPGFAVRALTFSDDGRTLFIEQGTETDSQQVAWDVATRTSRPVTLGRDGGRLSVVAKNPGDVTAWFADLDKVPKLALARTDGGRTQLRVASSDGGAWMHFADFGPEHSLRVLGLGAQGRTVVMATTFLMASGERLIEKSLLTGAERELGRWPMMGGSVGFHPTRRVVQFHPSLDGGIHFVDSAFAVDWQELSGRCPQGFEIVSRDKADAVWRVVCRRSERVDRFVWSRQEKREMPPRL